MTCECVFSLRNNICCSPLLFWDCTTGRILKGWQLFAAHLSEWNLSPKDVIRFRKNFNSAGHFWLKRIIVFQYKRAARRAHNSHTLPSRFFSLIPLNPQNEKHRKFVRCVLFFSFPFRLIPPSPQRKEKSVNDLSACKINWFFAWICWQEWNVFEWKRMFIQLTVREWMDD